MEGDDVEYMAMQLKELDKQVFKLRDSNIYLQMEGIESGMDISEIEEIVDENNTVIKTKMGQIVDFAKRFPSDDKDLPYIIPFTFNDLPSIVRGGRTIDPNKVLKEAIEREAKIKKLYENLRQKQEELREKYAKEANDEMMPEEGKDETIAEENKEAESEGMYL